MNDNYEQKIEAAIKAQLQRQYQLGLRAGISVISKVVLEKLNDSSKPFVDRINAVKRYCSVPFRNIDEFMTKGLTDSDVLKAQEAAVENDDN